MKQLLSAVFLIVLVTGGSHVAVLPVALQCEHRVNPLGIAATQPRLSLQIKSDGKNVLRKRHAELSITHKFYCPTGSPSE